MDKQEYAEQFGRWVAPNEIIIEDLEEEDLFSIAEEMYLEGYKLEYWKAPKQKSGHLHIKNLQFNLCPAELTEDQTLRYKELIMQKYIPENLWSKVDWNFVKTKKHRIAEENKPHFKGYGIKQLIKVFGERNENQIETELYHKAKTETPSSKEFIVNPNAQKIQDKIKITDVARKYGITLHGDKCLCPFHADKNPSLIFSDEKGCFYCFGCLVKGGIIKFVQMMEDLKNGSNKNASQRKN